MAGGAAKSLPDVIRKALDVFAGDLHVGGPGRIETFDAATGLASVKPLVRDVGADGVTRSVPVVCNVPVQFPGAGSFRVTFPVKPGDPCFLIFSDRSLDVWIAQGGEVDPVDPRRHALSDAVAILGVTDAAHPWSNVAADAATIGHDGAGPRVEFRTDEIRLDGGTAAVAREGDAVAAASGMSTWITAVNTALLGGGVGVPLVGVTVPAPTDFGVVDEGAARVKA